MAMSYEDRRVFLLRTALKILLLGAVTLLAYVFTSINESEEARHRELLQRVDRGIEVMDGLRKALEHR